MSQFNYFMPFEKKILAKEPEIPAHCLSTHTFRAISTQATHAGHYHDEFVFINTMLPILALGFHTYLVTQEKAFPTPARTKSYQPPSPPVPKVVPLVRSASEDQVVLKQQQEEVEEEVGELVKDEVPWTEAMVQDMFDCLDQVRQQQYDGHCIYKKHDSDDRSVERTPFFSRQGRNWIQQQVER